MEDQFDGKEEVLLDYYAMEEPWTLSKNHYSSTPEGNVIDIAKEIFNEVFGK